MKDGNQTGAVSARFSSVSAAPMSSPPAVSGERAVYIAAKVERISELARSHFDRHRQLWTNRQYGALLARDGGRMTLRPHSMPENRNAHLIRAADALVLHRQARRTARIERAANNVLGKSSPDQRQDAGR